MACDSLDQLREHGPIAGLTLVHCDDLVRGTQKSYSEQRKPQYSHDDG